MEDESLGPGVAATTEAPVGVGNAELAQGPLRSQRAGRNMDRDHADELTIAGVGWRPLGPMQGLVVMARGRGSGRVVGSLATLTVVHGDRSVQVTAPVGVMGAAGSLQTLRFVFRLPPSAPSWPISRLVLRFLGRNVDLDLPGEEPRTGPEATVPPPSAPAEDLPPDLLVTGADLVSLRTDIDEVSNELLRLLTETSIAGRSRLERAPGPEPKLERESERGDDRWLRLVAIHLEQMANELSECRSQFDRISQHLEARSATLADGEPRPDVAPSEEVAVEEEPLGEEVTCEEPFRQEVAAPSPGEIAEALAELRAELVRQALPEPEPDQEALDAAPEASEVEPVLPPWLPDWDEHEPGQKSWFSVALRRLAEHDLEAAGRVLVAVLPAQAIATPRYGRYDLIVGDHTIFAVDARPLDAQVQRLEDRRPLTETGAWIIGSFEALGRLVLKGRRTLLSRLCRRAVKVKGRRRCLSDLLALVAAPLRIRDLCAVGARVPPDLLLRMIIETARLAPTVSRPLSIQIEPREPQESRCTVIFDQSGARVLGPGAGPPEPTLVIWASSRGLMHLVAGLPSPEDGTATMGSPEPLRLLQDCVRRLELARFEAEPARRWAWRR